MPEYKVYKPNANLKMRMGPRWDMLYLEGTRVRDLPDEIGGVRLRNEVLEGVHDALQESGRLSEEALGQAADAHLISLAGLIDVGAVMDRWVAAATFDPSEVMEDLAAWVLTEEGGNQAILTAKLADNVFSPNGKAWVISAWKWSDAANEWREDELFALFPHDIVVKARQVSDIEGVFAGEYYGINSINTEGLVGSDRAETVRVTPEFARKKLQAGEPVHVGLHATSARDMKTFAALAMGLDKRGLPVFESVESDPLSKAGFVPVYEDAKYDELDVNRSSYYLPEHGVVRVEKFLSGDAAERANVREAVSDVARAIANLSGGLFEAPAYMVCDSEVMPGLGRVRDIGLLATLDFARQIDMGSLPVDMNETAASLVYDLASAARSVPFDQTEWIDDLTPFRDIDWRSRDAAAFMARNGGGRQGQDLKEQRTVPGKAAPEQKGRPDTDIARATGVREPHPKPNQVKQQRIGR